jgi:hypothetical protein
MLLSDSAYSRCRRISGGIRIGTPSCFNRMADSRGESRIRGEVDQDENIVP